MAATVEFCRAASATAWTKFFASCWVTPWPRTMEFCPKLMFTPAPEAWAPEAAAAAGDRGRSGKAKFADSRFLYGWDIGVLASWRARWADWEALRIFSPPVSLMSAGPRSPTMAQPLRAPGVPAAYQP